MKEIILVWTWGLEKGKVVLLAVLISLPLPSGFLFSAMVWWQMSVQRSRYASVLTVESSNLYRNLDGGKL